MISKEKINLEPRFLEPENWRWGNFIRENRQIRYGCLTPAAPAKAHIICLTGLSEFSEKYFETIKDLAAEGHGVWIMDWMGQGRSGRYLPNLHKRHSLGFDRDIADLHEFITKYVRPHADNAPLILLAHSMGGNIGLRYLLEHPGIFQCAGLSAPMCGIKAVRIIPRPLLLILLTLLNLCCRKSYVGSDGEWREDMREIKGHDPFSSDPVRKKIHNAWCLADPVLQVGRVTYGWVYHAVRSCLALQKELKRQKLDLPVLIGLAGDESFVDNAVTRRLAAHQPSIEILDLPTARHEILMEQDAIRTPFLRAFNAMILKENTKKGTL